MTACAEIQLSHTDPEHVMRHQIDDPGETGVVADRQAGNAGPS
jgi:hypothetical protein